ncbi:hypothetical protein HY409_00070 [Candidatus Gottesmanbacteria bacterium]|nr:hypothetical protein [Candidatus Gottesmanbacteria bacterium]
MAVNEYGITREGTPYEKIILEVGEEVEVGVDGTTLTVRGLEQAPNPIDTKGTRPDKLRVRSNRPYTDEVGPGTLTEEVYLEGSFATNREDGSLLIFSRVAVDGEQT